MTAVVGAVFELELPLIVPNFGRPGQPPLTANQRLHYMARSIRTRNLRECVKLRAIAARIPKCKHLTVQLHYRPGDNRRRDADNLYPTFKAACDALSRGPRGDWVGLLLVPDDTPEHMTKLAPLIHPGPGTRRLWLTVEVTA